MNLHARLPRLILLGAIATLAGCLFKPTTMPTRSFVLTPVPAAERGASNAGHLAIGVALVKMSPYLLRTSMAVRKGTNEIEYVENALWAERLDTSFQRTLAANLSALLPTDQIRLSSWQRGDAALAVYVSLEQFDVDAQGRGTLIAWWRITDGGGNKVLKSGVSRLNRSGSPPSVDPQNIATTLSDLTAEFSRGLAETIRQAGASVSAR